MEISLATAASKPSRTNFFVSAHRTTEHAASQTNEIKTTSAHSGRPLLAESEHRRGPSSEGLGSLVRYLAVALGRDHSEAPTEQTDGVGDVITCQ